MSEKKSRYTEAQKRAFERYSAEKTDTIRARLPRGYAQKVEQTAQILHTSKAQVLKISIDMLYSKVVEGK